MTLRKKRGPKAKSSFYHTRWHKAGLNEERAAEILSISVDEVRRFDIDGAPIYAERLLLLWQSKCLEGIGWHGWKFRRGKLCHGSRTWTPDSLKQIDRWIAEADAVYWENERQKTWPGFFKLGIALAKADIVYPVMKRRWPRDTRWKAQLTLSKMGF